MHSLWLWLFLWESLIAAVYGQLAPMQPDVADYVSSCAMGCYFAVNTCCGLTQNTYNSSCQQPPNQNNLTCACGADSSGSFFAPSAFDRQISMQCAQTWIIASAQITYTTQLTDTQGFRNWCTALYNFEVGQGDEPSGALSVIPTGALSMPGPAITSTSEDLSQTTQPPPLPSGASNTVLASTRTSDRAMDGGSTSGIGPITSRSSSVTSADVSTSAPAQASNGSIASNSNSGSGISGPVGIGIGIGVTLLFGLLAATAYLIWRLRRVKRSGEKNANAVPVSSPWSPGSGSDGLQVVNPSQINTPSTVSGAWRAVSPADVVIPTQELPVHGPVPPSHGGSFAELEALKMP